MRRLAPERVVQPRGAISVIRVPWPGALSICNLPPKLAMRSRMLKRPSPLSWIPCRSNLAGSNPAKIARARTLAGLGVCHHESSLRAGRQGLLERSRLYVWRGIPPLRRERSDEKGRIPTQSRWVLFQSAGTPNRCCVQPLLTGKN